MHALAKTRDNTQQRPTQGQGGGGCDCLTHSYTCLWFGRVSLFAFIWGASAEARRAIRIWGADPPNRQKRVTGLEGDTRKGPWPREAKGYLGPMDRAKGYLGPRKGGLTAMGEGKDPDSLMDSPQNGGAGMSITESGWGG